MSPAIADLPSALQPLTSATDPIDVGDSFRLAVCSCTDLALSLQVPWARGFASLAIVLAGLGFAVLPPTPHLNTNRALPDQCRIGSGAAGYDLQETPMMEVVPLKSPDVTMISATPRQLRNNAFQKIFTPKSKDYVSYLAGAD